MEKLQVNNGVTEQIVYFCDCRDGMKQFIEDNSIDLIITSPPYWNLKDYQHHGQIGFGQSLDEYLDSMKQVFDQCFRILKEARRMVVNVADIRLSNDTNADPKFRGNFSIIPLNSYIIIKAIESGFNLVGTVFWYKMGKCNAQNDGAPDFLGSYPYPPNAHVTSKVEYILVFRKKEFMESRPQKRSKDIKNSSRISRDEWRKFTRQIWKFPADHVQGHCATFPKELPSRCIKLWSFTGDTILDPFAGTCTTLAAAQEIDRNGLGFEINVDFKQVIKQRVNMNKSLVSFV